MSRSRLLNILIAIALVTALALTGREAFATADIISENNATNEKAAECVMLPPQSSVQTVYVPERGMWVTYTSQGPTGVDGGLMGMLVQYPACSR